MAQFQTKRIGACLRKMAIDDICNSDKTGGKLLVSSFGCAAEAAGIGFDGRAARMTALQAELRKIQREEKKCDEYMRLITVRSNPLCCPFSFAGKLQIKTRSEYKSAVYRTLRSYALWLTLK